MKTLIIDEYEFGYDIVAGRVGFFTRLYYGTEWVEEAYGFLYRKKRMVERPMWLFNLTFSIEDDTSVSLISKRLTEADIPALLRRRDEEAADRIVKAKWLEKRPLRVKTKINLDKSN